MDKYAAPLPKKSWADAASVLTDAFMHDPLFVALFSDTRRRPRALRALMRWQVRVRAADARVDTTPEGHAVAVWRPPHFHERASTLLRAAPLLGPVLRWCTLTGKIRRALDAMTRWQERRHEVLPHPHWYLEAVAVAPTWQRLGLGPILVRHGLQRADRTRLPVILETKNAHERPPLGQGRL